MARYSKILVAVDLSENSLPALKEALKFPDETDITCLHVVPETGEEAKSFQNFYDEDEAGSSLLENYALPWLENWISDAEVSLPDSIELEARIGTPHEEILNYAQEGSYGLIVIGTHGRSGFKRYWVGSVAESVLRRSTCPVLTVRTQDPNPEIIEDD